MNTSIDDNATADMAVTGSSDNTSHSESLETETRIDHHDEHGRAAELAGPGAVPQPKLLTADAHPLALVIPEMLRDEYCELERDIKAHGQREPIVLYEGKILDGRNRAHACAELGIEPKTTTFVGTMEEAKAMVISANVHRRHLTFAQKQQVIDAELLRDPTQSDRAIGRKVSVSKNTVAKARADAEARGQIDHVTQRKDSAGRSQPSTKRKLADGGVTAPAIEAAGILASHDAANRPTDNTPHVEHLNSIIAQSGELSDEDLLCVAQRILDLVLKRRLLVKYFLSGAKKNMAEHERQLRHAKAVKATHSNG